MSSVLRIYQESTLTKSAFPYQKTDKSLIIFNGKSLALEVNIVNPCAVIHSGEGKTYNDCYVTHGIAYWSLLYLNYPTKEYGILVNRGYTDQRIFDDKLFASLEDTPQSWRENLFIKGLILRTSDGYVMQRNM